MGASQSFEKVEHVAQKGYSIYHKLAHDHQQQPHTGDSQPYYPSTPVLTPGGTDDDQYAYFRAKAGEEADKRGDCFERSRLAYSSGSKAEAKVLSNQGHEHGRLMKQYNQQAADYIYEKNNGHRGPNEIDLHGLHVKEASAKVEEAILRCQNNGAQSLIIIVGKGLHSPGQIAKLKPAIIALVEKYEVSCTPDYPNPGCLFVEFGKGKGDLSWLDRLSGRMSNDQCVIM
ncbi:hypothetical protein BDB01DRAFT_713313 [Pilobolus umbonatus]|nr:hypothetical protein BDB01DRAFT_713313 [Pilobolus umbonatus]